MSASERGKDKLADSYSFGASVCLHEAALIFCLKSTHADRLAVMAC